MDTISNYVKENPIIRMPNEIGNYIESNLIQTTMIGDQAAFILTQRNNEFFEAFKLTEAKKQTEKILHEIMKLEEMLRNNEYYNQ
jgi:hypothetical protein